MPNYPATTRTTALARPKSDLPPVPATLKIPMFGHTVTLSWVQDLSSPDEEALWGWADYKKFEIRLNTCLRETPPNFQWNVLLHEFVHQAMFHQGRNELADDEAFVETTAQLILQLLQSIQGRLQST